VLFVSPDLIPAGALAKTTSTLWLLSRLKLWGPPAPPPTDSATVGTRGRMIPTRGGLGGPNEIWVHHPKLAKVMEPLGVYFRRVNEPAEHTSR
jgi:hypothetical protein